MFLYRFTAYIIYISLRTADGCSLLKVQQVKKAVNTGKFNINKNCFTKFCIYLNFYLFIFRKLLYNVDYEQSRFL